MNFKSKNIDEINEYLSKYVFYEDNPLLHSEYISMVHFRVTENTHYKSIHNKLICWIRYQYDMEAGEGHFYFNNCESIDEQTIIFTKINEEKPNKKNKLTYYKVKTLITKRDEKIENLLI